MWGELVAALASAWDEVVPDSYYDNYDDLTPSRLWKRPSSKSFSGRSFVSLIGPGAHARKVIVDAEPLNLSFYT